MYDNNKVVCKDNGFFVIFVVIIKILECGFFLLFNFIVEWKFYCELK